MNSIVYPAPLLQESADTGDSLDEEADQGMEILRGTTDFSGIRDYQAGDSPRHIHWGAYAKTGKVQTKTFVDYASHDLWLDWDALAISGTETKLSHLCAKVLQYYQEQQVYGLKIPGKLIQPASGEAHRNTCLTALALYGENDVIPTNDDGLRVMHGHSAQPGKITKAIVGLLGLGALAASGITFVSLDMMASLLMLGFAYKALEVIQKRDGIVPFWTVPHPGGHAKTGISDSMTPGDIAELSQSDALAFSVKFNGQRPKQNELYWRGLVLQHFDGKTWTQSDINDPAALANNNERYSEKEVLKSLDKQGEGIEYEVIYEKSGQPWLFALTPVLDLEGGAFYGADFRIIAFRDINEPKLLKLTSYPKSIRELELNEYNRELALQLPENDHQPLGGENSIDDFLIESKKGFCAHYAGSFVFMMRAAGIPARVVTGYQGGEWNEEGQFLAVHQFDAHAWTEVWLEGQGWVRKRDNEAIEHQLYRKFCEVLAKKGVTREISQTPEMYRQLAMKQLPTLAGEINSFTQAYSSICYDPSTQDNQQSYIETMQSLLKKLNR
ncbi:Protein-glutamine gamma-glutamyltransferase [Nymphon striatum]|nr:Protein-glutamine gamma-glutamyltransferase [Nymphon striatum]